MPLFESVSHNTQFRLGDDCRATFIEAGHILGSAMVLLEINRNGRSRRVLFTGDAGRFEVPILKDPTEPLPECDYLITECTYADRQHDNPTDMRERLCRIIAETRGRGGKVIIPAFSVGRTQTIIYYLIQLFLEQRLEEIPVFVDSPLSTAVTDVFGRHPECYDAEAIRTWGREGDLFGRSGPVRYITAVDDSKALNQMGEPAVILAASGMCEAGRILHHLKNHMTDEKNTICIVGFMAQHTLGRRLVERREEVRIFGRMYPLLARVEILNGFSAHADVTEFRRLYAPLAGKLKRAFVVHGEEKQPPAMAALLEELGCRDVVIPSPGDRFRI
jgi:metallo-beta-lactamase family protein